MESDQKTKPRSITGIVLIVIFVITAGFILYGIFSVAQYPWNKIGQASELISSRWGVSIYFVRGVLTIASIFYFFAWSKLLPTAWNAILGFGTPPTDPLFLFRNKWGWAIVSCIGLFYIVVGIASRQAYFYKYCAERPEGLYWTDNPGVEPEHGIPLTRCTSEQIDRITRPASPKELSVAEVKAQKFFNVDGYPNVWYTKNTNGAYRFFERGGFDAEGDKLQPVTHDVVADWLKRQQNLTNEKQALASRQHQQQLVAADVARARQQYKAEAFQEALDNCKPVLKIDPANDTCLEVTHDAAARLADQLAERAQAELQRGQFVDAARDAIHATSLDPGNRNAKDVLSMTNSLKKDSRQ